MSKIALFRDRFNLCCFTVLPVAASSSGVVTSLPQTIPLMVPLGNGDKQISAQGIFVINDT